METESVVVAVVAAPKMWRWAVETGTWIFVLLLECSKDRTLVFGSIFGTISVTSQICDSRFLCAQPCDHFLVSTAVCTYRGLCGHWSGGLHYAYFMYKMQYGSTSCVLIGPNETAYINPITNPTPPPANAP
jgi:hypothetical protein